MYETKSLGDLDFGGCAFGHSPEVFFSKDMATLGHIGISISEYLYLNINIGISILEYSRERTPDSEKNCGCFDVRKQWMLEYQYCGMWTIEVFILEYGYCNVVDIDIETRNCCEGGFVQTGGRHPNSAIPLHSHLDLEQHRYIRCT